MLSTSSLPADPASPLSDQSCDSDFDDEDSQFVDVAQLRADPDFQAANDADAEGYVSDDHGEDDDDDGAASDDDDDESDDENAFEVPVCLDCGRADPDCLLLPSPRLKWCKECAWEKPELWVGETGRTVAGFVCVSDGGRCGSQFCACSFVPGSHALPCSSWLHSLGSSCCLIV